MSTLSNLFGRVLRMDARPGWLVRCLPRARILSHGERGELILSVDVDDRVGTHTVFAKLQPRLVLEDGSEVPVTVLRHTQDSGFPVHCIVRPTTSKQPLPRDAAGNPQVRFLRVSYGSKTKDLKNMMRMGA